MSPWIGDTYFKKSEKHVQAGADLTDLRLWTPGWAADCGTARSPGCAEPRPGGASRDQQGPEQGSHRWGPSPSPEDTGRCPCLTRSAW